MTIASTASVTTAIATATAAATAPTTGIEIGGGIEITTEIKIEITGGTTTSVTPIDGARTGKTGNADRTQRRRPRLHGLRAP